MLNIALVDDRNSVRRLARKALVRAIGSDDFNVIESHPLASASDYPDWIARNEISAIIADYKLNGESGPNGESPVDYEADRLIEAVHSRLPFFPIFLITAYGQNEEVEEQSVNVELLKSREWLEDSPEEVSIRLRRAIGRYSENQQRKLARLSELCQLAARSELDQDGATELHALQAEFGAAYHDPGVLTDGDLFRRAEELGEKARDLLGRLRKQLGDT